MLFASDVEKSSKTTALITYQVIFCMNCDLFLTRLHLDVNKLFDSVLTCTTDSLPPWLHLLPHPVGNTDVIIFANLQCFQQVT